MSGVKGYTLARIVVLWVGVVVVVMPIAWIILASFKTLCS